MLAQRLRRWANIIPALNQSVVFAGKAALPPSKPLVRNIIITVVSTIFTWNMDALWNAAANGGMNQMMVT